MTLRNLSKWGAVAGNSDDASVSRLRLMVGPSTVFGAVVPVPVDSVNGEVVRVPGGLCPAPKRSKVMPRIAYGYALSAISRITGVCAAAAHVLPAFVKPGFGFSVLSSSITYACARSGASARNALAVAEVCAGYLPSCSALALAHPKRAAAWLVAVLGKHSPQAALAASHVDQSRVICHA